VEHLLGRVEQHLAKMERREKGLISKAALQEGRIQQNQPSMDGKSVARTRTSMFGTDPDAARAEKLKMLRSKKERLEHTVGRLGLQATHKALYSISDMLGNLLMVYVGETVENEHELWELHGEIIRWKLSLFICRSLSCSRRFGMVNWIMLYWPLLRMNHSIPAAVITSRSDLIVVLKTCSNPPSFAHAAIRLGSCDSTLTSSCTLTLDPLYVNTSCGSTSALCALCAASGRIPTAAANRSRKPKGEVMSRDDNENADLLGSGDMTGSKVRSSAVTAASVMYMLNASVEGSGGSKTCRLSTARVQERDKLPYIWIHGMKWKEPMR
jgi:hypothetical protein